MSNHRQPGQRAGLSAETVLATARVLADKEGLEAVTMRSLAEALGVLPNAIYSYFPSKDVLVDSLLDSVLGEIDVPDLDTTDWRDGLIEIMDTSRRLLAAHPKLVTSFLTRPRLGPNAVRLGEATLRLLDRGGVRGEDAVGALRVLLGYSMGFAALSAPRQGNEERAERAEAALRSLPKDEFAAIRSLATPLSRPPTDEQFLTGLRWLVHGLATS